MRDIVLVRLIMFRARGARGRFVAVAGGVALGVILLTMLIGAFSGLTVRALRAGWSDPALVASAGGGGSVPVRLASDQMLLSSQAEWFRGKTIIRVDVAARPGASVSIPGLATLPAPGHYDASPALRDLIRAVPGPELGERYGSPSATITPAGLTGPDSLLVIVRVPIASLANSSSKVLATGTVPSVSSTLAASSYGVTAVIGLVAVTLPVILLLAIVMRLGVADREERLAVIRMIGAPAGEVARLAGIEAAMIATVGAGLGTLLSWLLIPAEAEIPVEGTTFFPADLAVSPLVRLGIFVAVGVTASLAATLRARVGPMAPFSSVRQRAESEPRKRGVLLLVGGLLVLSGLVATATITRSNPEIGSGASRIGLDAPLVVVGVALTALGVLLAGPVLVSRVARFAAGRVESAASVIALNRIRRHPRGTFRSVSGIVLGVYTVSLFAGATSSAASTSTTLTGPGYLPPSTLTAQIDPSREPTASELGKLLHSLNAVPGVEHAIVGRLDPREGLIFRSADMKEIGFTAAPGKFVHVANGADDNSPVQISSASVSSVDRLPVAALWVINNGNTHAIESARTLLIKGVSLVAPPVTRVEQNQNALLTLMQRWADLANIGTMTVAAVSAIAVAVASAVSVIDRRRTLAALGLVGMPRHTVRDILAIETLVPLASVILGAAVAGLFSAWCVLAGLTGGARTLGRLSDGYWMLLVSSLAVAVFAVAVTLPTANRSTRPSSLRVE